jgi:hypothetical protein
MREDDGTGISRESFGEKDYFGISRSSTSGELRRLEWMAKKLKRCRLTVVALAARSDSVSQKIAIEIWKRCPVFLAAVHRVAEKCARSREFLAATGPSGIRNSEVEEFEGPHKRLFAEVGVPAVPFADSSDFTSDVRQLIDK